MMNYITCLLIDNSTQILFYTDILLNSYCVQLTLAMSSLYFKREFTK